VKWTRSFIFIAFAVFALSFNQGVVNSVSMNFFGQDLGITGAQMGYYTAARELMGFGMVLVAAVTVRFSVSKVAAVALLIAALGYGAYSQANTFAQLLVVAMIGSLGFHTWMQVYYVLALSLADEGFEGRVLGKLSSVGSTGTLLAMFITLSIVAIVGMRNMYLISATVVIAASIGLWFVPKSSRLVRQQGFCFKRRYWLYYTLNFLDGCRAEIFMTFGLFALVDIYHLTVQQVTVLLICTALINWFAAPRFGALVDRLGERPVLTLAYSASAVVFLAFAFVPNGLLLSIMYIIYGVFGVAMMARNTYLKKIAAPTDVAPSLAMGVTMMHAAAVVVPIAGSILWSLFGYQMSFLLGAAFILISIVFTQFIRVVAPQRVAVASQ
jgi:predicted MFS family arabinose efflux permease